MNSSAKYKDLICKTNRIQSGPPAVYQLKPKKERFDTVTRMTVGERNPNKINKTILLVGETGTGKSSLINALINYTIGVKWEEGVWFQIVEDEKRSQAESQAESQTSDVIVYEIFGFEKETLTCSLTIIDTPGFGDTHKDDIVMKKLHDLFRSEDGVHEVHAVGLVMKASENRLSERQIYIFSSVMSLFGKDVEKHIVALITHSDGVKPKNALEALEAAKIKCARNEKNEPVYFLFNNQQFKERTEEVELGLENAWRVTEEGMRQFGAFMERAAPQNIKETGEVMNERIRLTACIQNLADRIKLAELKQTEIRQIEEALRNHEKEMEKNKNLIIEVDEAYKDKEDIDGGMWLFFYQGAVCCTVCKENCHYPGCTVAWYPKHCEVISRGRCKVCTGKCHVSVHVKEKWKYVTKTQKTVQTLENIKRRFEKNKSESENKSGLLENLKKEMNQLRAEKKQFLDQSYQHVLRLEQIALKADSASTIVHLDFLIEKMKEEGDTEKVQKLEKMRSRVDEGTRSALRDKFEKL